RTPHSPWRRATIIWSCGLSFALLATWVARSVILSGCPIYPSRILAAPVEWCAPSEAAGGLRAEFRSDSQRSRMGMLQRAVASPGFQRIPQWLARPLSATAVNPDSKFAWMITILLASTIELALPGLLAIVALGAIVLRTIASKPRVHSDHIEWIACIPPLIGLGVWALAAPEPRYAASLCWILAAVLLTKMIGGKCPGPFIAVIAALSMLIIAYRMLVLNLNPAGEPVRSALFIPAGPDHGFHPTPVADMQPFTTNWGLVVFVPKDFKVCWNAPLPSTTAPNPFLRLRIIDDLESGFVLDRSAAMNE